MAKRRVYGGVAALALVGLAMLVYLLSLQPPSLQLMLYGHHYPRVLEKLKKGPHLGILEASGCSACHRVDLLTPFRVVFEARFAPVKPIACISCHGIPESKLHEVHLRVSLATGCYRCHDPHDASVSTSKCLQCHAESEIEETHKGFHTGLNPNCSKCHGTGEEVIAPLSPYCTSSCFQCHDLPLPEPDVDCTRCHR